MLSFDNDCRANQSAQDEPASALQPGTLAPDFTLHSTPDHVVSLRDFRGHPVILAFYPADWSPVCGDQMALYNEILPEFGRFQAQLLGISVDGVWCHAAFARDRKLHFPLLADFEPKGPSPNAMACIVVLMGRVNAPYSCWTPRGSFAGATFLRSRSTPVPMAS